MKRFELYVNPQTSACDIKDNVESEMKNAICIYNDLGIYPFTSAPALCDLLNELYDENVKYKNVFEKINKRIGQLNEDLNDSSDDFIPRDSVFNNPMSDTYRKEMREELSALKWVLRLLNND